MHRINATTGHVRSIGLTLLVLLPAILAACSKGSGGSSY